MSSIPYQVYLQSQKWKNLRIEIWSRARGICAVCGRTVSLQSAHIHHEEYSQDLANVPKNKLRVTHGRCHEKLGVGVPIQEKVNH